MQLMCKVYIHRQISTSVYRYYTVYTGSLWYIFLSVYTCSTQAKQQPVKSVRQMPVATVTDNVATKAKRNEPQGGAAIRGIPTSSVTIKPKTGYSFSGATDGGTRKASVAKPQRAKQLIQAPPAKKLSSKAKNTTSEVLSFSSI